MVPNGWEVKKLEDLCAPDAPITYGVLKPGEYCSNGIPLLQIKDLSNGHVSSQDLHLISKELDEEYKRSRILKNDILISLVGTIGRVAKFELSSPANIHRNLGRVRTDYHEFIFHFLNSDVALKLMGDSSSGSSQSALNLSTLRAMKVPFPPFKEQQKIAQILSTWDQAISVTEKLLENSQQQKKALMQQLLTGKKRLLDENGVRFSGEWCQKLVEECFDVGSSKRVLQADWKSVGVPFYRTRELVSLSKKEAFRSEIFISDELFLEITNKYGFPTEGDFLVSGVGTLGISYQVKDGDKFYFKDGNVIWFKLKNHIFSDYFKYCFQSEFFQEQIEAQASVTTVGTYTIQNAKKTKFWCPPSMQEQRKIAKVLCIADQEIETLQEKLDCLKQEKKALMQQLLTGKKRVKVAA